SFAGWYDPNWSTRRPVTIDNTGNSNTLYDFQVKLHIPYYTGMQDDFDDIRFTIDDEVTSIPYWIEEHNPSDYAIAWVKVSIIPALDTTIIYLYYGNPDAVSESNGEAVFEYFDDFNDQDISDWSIIYGEWTAFNEYLEQSQTANHMKALSSYSITDASVTEAKMVYISSYHYSGNHIFFSKDSWGDNGYKFGYAGLNVGGSRICKIEGGWVSNLITDTKINIISYAYVWLKSKITYDDAGNLSLLLITPDSVQVFLEVYDITFGLPFTLGAYCGSHIGIDDLRIRQYTDPEPSYTIGTQQGIEEKPFSNFIPSIPKLSPMSSNLAFPVEFLLELPRDSEVSGDIYDCSGRKIATFIKNQELKRGKHNLKLEKGNHDFSSGIYFLRLIIREHKGRTHCLMEKV
ncbi:DUF2341 domain-containing protein, partial [candidate division WOR-3 bacterium]|nr:DUF2341 domain-containing protein [candidate division WOR-3 bacterium]